MRKSEREAVFNMFGGKCAYCGCDLLKGWHVDHFEPIIRDWVNGGCEKPQNECVENYIPSCASCNIMKSSEPLEAFRAKIFNFVNSLNIYSTQYKFAKRYGLIEETPKPIVFYFETHKDVTQQDGNNA